MKTLTAKIKTAAIAASLVAGIAGGAAAQGTNPFVNGEIPNRNTPNVTSPYGSPNEGNRYGNPNDDRSNYTNVDMRLGRYLVGTWQGQLKNGGVIRIRFSQDGRVALAQRGADIALVGRYRVVQGSIRIAIVARCSLSTRQCEKVSDPKVTTIGFRPVDGQTLQVRTGYMRRVG